MIDKYTKDMLFTNIIDEYSDAKQLEIIEYLVKALMDWQHGACGYDKDSIEEIYYKGLEKVLNDIKELREKEKEFLLDK